MKLFCKICVLFSLSVLLLPADVWAQQTVPTAGQQVETSLKVGDASIPYLLYLPKDYSADSEKKFPLMLFLHGRGESYGPLDLVTKWGPPRFAKRGDELPFILVSPQCPKESHWKKEDQQKLLVGLLDHVTKTLNVDTDRVMLTGLSMGGYGSWQLAGSHANRFSCCVPVCGSGNPEDAEQLKKLPIWVFHGDQDRAVPFSKSVEMVDAIKKAGGKKIRFTTMEHVGHNSWSSTYAMPELYGWMLKQSASANAK